MYISVRIQLLYLIIIILLVYLYYATITSTHEGFQSELFDIPHYLPKTKDIGKFVNGVPLVIYESWNTRKIPKGMKNNIDMLRKVNPEFDVYIYSDVECAQFIKDNFNRDVLNAFNSIIPGAYKSDLWRYCILYIKGGVYLDIKFYSHPQHPLIRTISSWFCEKNSTANACRLENIIPSIQDISVEQKKLNNTNAIFVQDGIDSSCYPYGVYNGFMASMPNNPIFKDCIDEIVVSYKNKNIGVNPLDLTGPCLLGRHITNRISVQYILQLPFTYSNATKFGPGIELQDNIFLQHYSSYRDEQKSFQNNLHYAEAWRRGITNVWK